MTDLETVKARTTIKYPVYRGRSEHDVQCVSYIILLEDRAQPSQRYQKCNDLRSCYSRSEQKLCVSCTQWLLKPSQQVQGPYADIQCKRVTNYLLGASRHVYG
ncbi:hypothetical protein TNCV_5091341 [Trichonephila clavipes]|nr:hypothetical protein TNCV_5091341 [Trichonephila clavipes]